MKKDRVKDLFLEQLKKVPNVQVAVEKVGIARSTVYKWKSEDEAFAKAMEEALAEGEAMLNDLGENQLYSLMLERHYPSIQFWLRHRNPKFKDKIEVITRTAEEKEKISAEQDSIVEQGLAMLEDSAEIETAEEIISPNTNQHDTTTENSDTTGANYKEQNTAEGGGTA